MHILSRFLPLILVTPMLAAEKPEQHERLRTYDVQHIKAELSIDPQGAQLSGKVTHTIKPLHDGLKTWSWIASRCRC